MAEVDPSIEELAESLQQQLKVVVSSEEEVTGGGGDEGSDDGYISSGSTENLTVAAPEEEQSKPEEQEKKADDEGKDDEKEDDDDDEKILEPLVIIDEKAAAPLQPGIEFISRGPVSVDQLDHRFQPYGRNPIDSHHHHHQHQTQQQHHPDLELVTGDEESYVPPKPILLVYTKKDKENPTRLDGAPIEWSDKHELCIAKFPLPEDTAFEGGAATCAAVSQVQIFVQLNPASRDTNTFLAHVKAGLAIKKPTKKTHPKKATQRKPKNPHKNPLKCFYFYFLFFMKIIQTFLFEIDFL
jgi:hypothetical protein